MMKLYTNRTIITVIAILLLIMSTISYTLFLLADANQKVTQDITQFSRGSYDILIRPPDARTVLEKQLNVIEENYLGVGDGGITINEWQRIKEHPAVEFAAPVASIGLFTARERTFMMERNPEDATYYEVAYHTSDGVKEYSNTEQSFLYDLGSQFGDFKIYPSSLSLLDRYVGVDIASFRFPVSYHQVVAIDPMEEERLTGYDLSPLTVSYLEDFEAYENGRYSIPIMSLRDVSVPVKIDFTVDSLTEIEPHEVEEWDQQFDGGNPYRTLEENTTRYQQVVAETVAQKRSEQEQVYNLVPEADHSPFKQMLLYLNDDHQLTSATEEDAHRIGGGFSQHSQRVGYRLNPVVYEIKNNQTLAVKQIGTDQHYQAPVYRQMEEVVFYQLDDGGQPIQPEDYVGFIENGSFSIAENVDSLAASPLGIYGGELPYLADDPTVKLHPSAVPGSFITTPAHGLIGIEYAEKIKGDAPIDAIRVKVAGIHAYNKKAATLIRELADEWQAQGFTVDIVAGASLQNLTVEVEGIGEVIQSFTTLGAADTVVSSWNAIQIALTLLFILVAFTFVAFTFFNLVMDRQRDERLLAQLGWSEKMIRRIRFKEWGWMLGVPILIVGIVFILFGALQGEWSPFGFAILVSCCHILIYVLAERLKKASRPTIKRQYASITKQNIRYYFHSLITPWMQLFFTTVLTCFLPFFLLQNVENATRTRLGSYVHGEIEGIFILVLILLYGLSVVTVYQSLARMWKKREKELQLFLYVGWDNKQIVHYFMKEICIWSGLAIATGWTISVVLLITVGSFSLSTIGVGFLVASMIFVLTCLGSVYSLHVAIRKGDGKHANTTS